MSASFEKETTSSTAKSLVGALVALGSGFIFMFLGLAAVTASSAQAEGEKSVRALVLALETDLLSYQGGISVSNDQKLLKFKRQGPGTVEEITYKVSGDSGEVTRVLGGEIQKLAKLDNPRFDSNGSLLRLRWGQNGKFTRALFRWSGKRSS